MRTTCSTAEIKILPSPILPVCADLIMASTAASSRLDGMTTSTLILGKKSTTYSAPRYNSVCPFCRPKPFTSVTVSPLTPNSESASRTSSNLNGLITASIFFIVVSLLCRYQACNISNFRQSVKASLDRILTSNLNVQSSTQYL